MAAPKSAFPPSAIIGVAVLALVMICCQQAFGWADGESDGDGGCCGEAVQELLKSEPESVSESGMRFTKQLINSSNDWLGFLIGVGPEICDHTNCGELSPEQASKIAAIVLENKRHRENNQTNIWIAIGTGFTALIAGASLVLGILNNRRSRRNERLIAELR